MAQGLGQSRHLLELCVTVGCVDLDRNGVKVDAGVETPSQGRLSARRGESYWPPGGLVEQQRPSMETASGGASPRTAATSRKSESRRVRVEAPFADYENRPRSSAGTSIGTVARYSRTGHLSTVRKWIGSQLIPASFNVFL